MKDDPNLVSLKVPSLGDLDNIEIAVWAAQFVHFRAVRSESCKRWPPNEDDIDDAIADANEVIFELRRARERNR